MSTVNTFQARILLRRNRFQLPRQALDVDLSETEGTIDSVDRGLQTRRNRLHTRTRTATGERQRSPLPPPRAVVLQGDAGDGAVADALERQSRGGAPSLTRLDPPA